MVLRPLQPWFATAKRTLFGAVLLALCGSYGIREDEAKCEQAVNYLQECCGAFWGHSFRCEYSMSCRTQNPTDLSVATSECVLGKSCAELQSSGICDPETWPTARAPECS